MHLMTEEAGPNILQFKTEKRKSATATTIEQAQLLIQEDYECVTEMNDAKLFRERK